jgi:subtilisin family serine protease
VAGTIGAIDNGEGVVGIAPGARMWAVKVLSGGGTGLESWIIAGVDWVTAHASEIEVANMSLGCGCAMPALDTAINKSVEAGVVYVVAAGNNHSDAKTFSPANNPNVITVSALADYDGEPGGKSSYTCELYGSDDTSATFSNYGSTVEVVAPGVCILSTVPGNQYAYLSGTSMASPHVAGAAAILASQKNPANKAEVEAIRSTIMSAGNLEWTDNSGDGVKEKLLDVKNETTFKLATVPPPPPPKNTSLPVISPATPFENVSASTTNGSWTEKRTSFKYQWKRCNSGGAECTTISGATSATYKPIATDVGKTLRVDVTAKNSGGEATATSNATSPVKPTGEVTTYQPAGEIKPTGIIAGPDGNVWFTNTASSKIGKITTSGTITEYAIPGGAGAMYAMVTGPDGNLWVSSNAGNGSKVIRVTTGGSITEFALPTTPYPTGIYPEDIAVGPDNRLWMPSYAAGKLAAMVP